MTIKFCKPALFITITFMIMQSSFLFAAPLVYEDIRQMIEDKDFDKAEFALKTLVALNDKDVTALSMIGELYHKMGDRNKAAIFLKKAISIEPSYPPAHFYLGKNYYMQMKNSEAVAEFAIFRKDMKKLPKLTDNDQAFYFDALDIIGEVYFNLKMFNEFYAVNQEILDVLPNDGTALYNMGVYYYVYNHNNSKAYQSFSKVINIDSNSSMADKARYAIEFIRANPDSRVAPSFDFIDVVNK